MGRLEEWIRIAPSGRIQIISEPKGPSWTWGPDARGWSYTTLEEIQKRYPHLYQQAARALERFALKMGQLARGTT
jgi:hypothetical protein